MHRKIDAWYSHRLNKQMEIVTYGHFGPALLMFPSAGADYLEYERFFLIDSIRHLIDAGKVKVFSINSINLESWLNHRIGGRQKAIRHQQYNAYIENEVVPFIRNSMGGSGSIITCGVSLGAFHGANMLFRRPDLFGGTIGLSGIYDLKEYAGGYWDQDVYFNSPVDYLPHLGDPQLGMLRNGKSIHFLSGSGPYEAPQESRRISEILSRKGVHSNVEVWGAEWSHDWPTWREMLPSYLGRLLG
ncbi:MAG TPA: alpha/beta hydrolase-fold protein [Candidatus Kapabacteria bacterium]|jgi:esterase/lipase superfamily enzyme|nr:alpha/beta hydrolase-fold protein [Candidatus Kapabacteria bacterium]